MKIKPAPEKIEQALKAIHSDTDSQQLFDYNKMIPRLKSLEVECDERQSKDCPNCGVSCIGNVQIVVM